MRGRVLGAALLALAVGCESESTAPAPQDMVFESAWSPPESSVVGKPVAGIPAVRVTTADGTPVEGFEVYFIEVSRLSPPPPTPVLTNADGVATADFAWTLGIKAGMQRVMAFSPRAGAASITFEVTAIADSAKTMSMSIGPSSKLSAGDSVRPTLEYRDLYQNLAVAPGPVTFTFTDSSVLTGSGEWVRANDPGFSRVIARSGSLGDTVSVAVGYGEPAVVFDHYAAGAGFAMTIDANRVLYTVDWNTFGIRRFNLATRSARSTLLATASYRDVKYVPSRAELWVLHFTDSISVYSLGPLTLLRRISVPGYHLRLLPAPDGSAVFLTGLYGALSRVDAATGVVTTATENLGDAVNGIAVGSNPNRLYVTSANSGFLYEYDAVTLARLRQVGIGGMPQEVLVDTTSKRIIVMREFGALRVLDEQTLQSVYDEAPSVSQAYGAAFSLDRRYIVVAAFSAQVQILDAVSLQIYSTIPASRARRVIFDPVGGDAWIVQESSTDLIRIALTAP